MANLMQASNQWATRPADQRFTSLPSMLDHFLAVRRNSRQLNVGSRQIHALPTGNTVDSGLQIMGPNGGAADPTHWAFGQLANLAGAPAGYLRTLPAPIAADCINVGLAKRPVEDVGLLISRTTDGSVDMRAATGPRDAGHGLAWRNLEHVPWHAKATPPLTLSRGKRIAPHGLNCSRKRPCAPERSQFKSAIFQKAILTSA